MAAEFQSVLGLDVSSVMVSRACDLNAEIEVSFEVLGNEGLKGIQTTRSTSSSPD
jgi:hypothetical protein